MSNTSKDPVEVDFHHETAEGDRRRGALLVTPAGELGAEKVWLPKSEILDLPEDRQITERITITIPEWLATEKGLV